MTATNHDGHSNDGQKRQRPQNKSMTATWRTMAATNNDFLADRTNDLAYAATLRPSGVCLSFVTYVSSAKRYFLELKLL